MGIGLTEEEWEFAAVACTERQLTAMRMRDAGLSWRSVSRAMEGWPSVTTVRDLVRRGIANVKRDGD